MVSRSYLNTENMSNYISASFDSLPYVGVEILSMLQVSFYSADKLSDILENVYHSNTR